ncbi:MAG: hypothetical protein O2782_13515 [bacterium]|nr:hypothetical protein [bacterium]
MTRISCLLAAGAAVLALTALGCGGDGSTLGPDGTPLAEDGTGDGDPTVAVTLAQLSSDIFTPKCATSGCHSGGSPAQGMSLTSANVAAATIGVASAQVANLKRIDPGNPDGSYLLQKVRGTGAGSQMPLGGAPLSASEIQLIVDWVSAGAPVQ